MKTDKYFVITVNEKKYVDIEVYDAEELAIAEVYKSFGKMLFTEGSGSVTDAKSQWVDDVYFYGVLIFGKTFTSSNNKITKLIIKKI